MEFRFDGVCGSFARWILAQKRRLRPSGLYVVGVNGTVGQGKSVFSQALVTALNGVLKASEGRALTRSLDDFYLPKAKRYRPEFLARGYCPDGIPNRGPAGTHEVGLLRQSMEDMEQGVFPLELPVFDKQADDRSASPLRIDGKVGVFVLEGWFVGARTTADPRLADPGLRRSVALALKDYQPIFARLDALWVFAPPKSLEDIVAQRLEQQDTLNRGSGVSGMTPAQIRRFIDYFYRDAWQPGLTSPTPAREIATFWASTDLQHQFLAIDPPFDRS